MIYAIKLLLGLLAIMGTTLIPLRGHLARLLGAQQFGLWTTALVGSTAVAFLSGEVNLNAFLLGILAWTLGRQTADQPAGTLALFLVMLLASPSIKYTPSGFGEIANLLEVSPSRILCLALLTPMALRLVNRPVVAATGGRRALDVAIVLLFLVRVFSTETLFTASNTGRLLLGETLDLLVPYWVISRGVRPEDVKTILSALVLSCTVMAAIALVEFLLDRHYYNPLQAVYGVQWQLTYALTRGDWLRSQASMPQPIVLAFVLIHGLAALWAVAGRGRRSGWNALIFVLISAGIVATYSRGPWVAAAALALLLWGAPRLGTTGLRLLAAAVVLGLPVALLSGLGDEVFDALKNLFGTSAADAGSIDYRQELLETARALIAQSPWTGVPDYASHMQHLIQGEGIIDIVNAYVGITLAAGVLGLVAFVSPLLLSLLRRLHALQRADTQAIEARDIDIALFSLTLVSLMVLVTTSSFSVMPMLLLLLAALPPACASIGTDRGAALRPMRHML